MAQAAKAEHPYHPITYVRGFAASQGEIEDTVGDPYMGLNIGSTKARADGRGWHQITESPNYSPSSPHM